MIKLAELINEKKSNFDEREYQSMLYQAEKEYINDKEALKELIRIYRSHLRDMEVFFNNAERGIKN
jgi:hypothetical protein